MLGVESLNNFSADIDHLVKQFNCKYYIRVYLYFKYLQCDIFLSNMISTYCLDASQLWDYEDTRIEKYYVDWRKAMKSDGI